MTTVAAEGRARRRSRSRRRLRTTLIAVAFLLPSAVPLAMFTLYPMGGALWVSLHKWNLLSPMEWAGLSNYTKLLADPQTLNAFGNTFYYILGYLPLVYFGGLIWFRRDQKRDPIQWQP